MAEALPNIERLEQRLHADWTHLKKARQLALAKRVELQSALAGLDSEDTSIVVFSNDLIRQLGGDEDTNRNTTRRLLLLPEFWAVRPLTGALLEISDSFRRILRVIGGRSFRDGLMTIFFDPQSGLEELTKNYGVF